MKPALTMLLVAAGEVWLASVTPAWAGWFLLWAGASTGWVGLAYALGRPELLGKQHAPRLAGVALWPFLAFARGVARAAQRAGLAERAEVAPGLWVGAWPRPGPSPFAHLDLTAELPRRAEPLAYRALPMLDGAAPAPETWEEAVRQVLAWRRSGMPVLVHCAYGHGRSVAVVVGVLVREGLEPDVESAHARVLRVRPRARMAAAQRALVWSRLGQSRAPEGTVSP